MFIKKLTACLLVLLLLVTLFNIGWSIHDCYFDDIKILPEGEFHYNSMSPDTETTIYVYKVNVPGGSSMRVSAVTVSKDGITSERNIYWEVGAERVESTWISDKVVSLNGNLVDVSTGEVYDSRYDIPLPETLTNN